MRLNFGTKVVKISCVKQRNYLNLAEHDNVGAQESLFFIYSRDQVGVGLGKKNLSEAIKWGMKAAQNGCVNVQALLAISLFFLFFHEDE